MFPRLEQHRAVSGEPAELGLPELREHRAPDQMVHQGKQNSMAGRRVPQGRELASAETGDLVEVLSSRLLG
jgi:hypothetical protein